MRHYKHLTRYERENLLFLRAKGYSITAIAESMGCNKGTISRELRRNSVANQYMPVVAQHQYQARRAYCKPHNRLEHARLLEHVKHRLLECQWSPEEMLRQSAGQWLICFLVQSPVGNAWQGQRICPPCRCDRISGWPAILFSATSPAVAKGL